jgi:hypothetical protein
MKELFPEDAHLHRWLDMARRAHRLPGPAGAHLLDRPGRAPPGRPGLQRDGEERRAEGPIVIGRDHLDSGSVASPTARPSHEGRQRCRERLAAAQRAAQHRRRRHLGQPAPRRRRGHGLLAALAAWSSSADGTDEAATALSACCGTTRHRRDAPCRCRTRATTRHPTLDRPAARRHPAPAPIVVQAAAAGDAPVYGVNTGFGKLANTAHQRRRPGHAAAQPDPLAQRGRGRAAAPPVVRLMLLLKAASLARGLLGRARPVVDRHAAGVHNAGWCPSCPARVRWARRATWRRWPT